MKKSFYAKMIGEMGKTTQKNSKKNINFDYGNYAWRVYVEVDKLDLKIIQALQKDARATFVEIARELKVTPGKVQSRFHKMKKTGLIKGSTIILSPSKIGIKVVATICVVALDAKIEEIVNYIKKINLKKTQLYIYYTFGRYNINVALISGNLMEVHRIKNLIRQHPGVTEVHTALHNDCSQNYHNFDLKNDK